MTTSCITTRCTSRARHFADQRLYLQAHAAEDGQRLGGPGQAQEVRPNHRGDVQAIVGITATMVVIMGWSGLTIMSFMYGIDFEPYRGLCFVMLWPAALRQASSFCTRSSPCCAASAP